MTLLSVENLSVHFPQGRRIARAADEVSFRIRTGERFGLVGESGCGKSVTARAVLGLLPKGAKVSGRVIFDGDKDILSLSEAELRKLRGSRIAAVFQDPMTYLNPVFTMGDQIAESLRLHRGMNKKDALEAAVELLRRVRIRNPETCAQSYPFQLSGGMRQRALIAAAVACGPSLLIADEPTTALDVTVQARILALLRELTEKDGTALWLITHDFGVVAETCETVGVMYAGRLAEIGRAEEVLRNPAHPYTEGLLSAVRALEAGGLSSPIPGQVHAATDHPDGCRFHPRCSYARPICTKESPPALALSDTHAVYCWKSAGAF